MHAAIEVEDPRGSLLRSHARALGLDGGGIDVLAVTLQWCLQLILICMMGVQWMWSNFPQSENLVSFATPNPQPPSPLPTHQHDPGRHRVRADGVKSSSEGTELSLQGGRVCVTLNM